MTDTRPLWLLDMDGVLNANRPGWGAAPHRTQVLADGEFWTLRWAPALVERIWALHRSGLVEIRWASTWVGHTGLIEQALRLPHFEDAYPYPGLPNYAGANPHPTLKLHAFLTAVQEKRRIIWTDDDAIPADWLSIEDTGGQLLLITPKPNRGLQPEHLDAIEAFTGQHAPEGAPA